MRFSSILVAAACVILSAGSAAAEPTVRTRGKLNLPASIALVAVSTDPVVQRVLNDDFYAAKRRPGADADVKAGATSKSTLTLTVTLTQRTLKPGVSLDEIAPGDPGVVSLLRAAGADPPPIGDTGNAQIDPYEAAARMEATKPGDPMLRQLRQDQAFQRSMGAPGTSGPRVAQDKADEQGYDTVIVARVTLDDRRDLFTVVAVAHPGDNDRDVKKLVAEEIANAALH